MTSTGAVRPLRRAVAGPLALLPALLLIAACAGNPVQCAANSGQCRPISPAHEALAAPQTRNGYPYDAPPATLYVGVGGSGDAVGSSVDPLDSLASALARARSVRDRWPGAAAVIELLPGTHYLDAPVVIGIQDAGTEEAPLVVRGPVGGEAATLSGGRRLTLQWHRGERDIWSARVTGRGFDQLFVDGSRLVRARYPNYDPDTAVYNGYTTGADLADRAKTWQDPEDGYIHGLHGGRWGGFHYRISGKGRDGSLLLEGGWQNNRPRAGLHENYQFADNLFEELDRPGEWFYDPKTSTLHVIPPPGVDLRGARVEVSGLTELLIVRGDSAQPARHISIDRLSFTHTGQTFMGTAEPLLRSDWTIYRGGALLIEGAEQVRVSGSRFFNLGGNGVFVSGYARDIVVAGNHFTDIDATAVAFVGRPAAVRSPAFQYHEAVAIAAMDMTPGPVSVDYPARCSADNNLIHDAGRLEKQAAGIQISMASEIALRHNSIYNLPRAGINVSDGTWGGHVLEYNDVFNTVLETEDHGAFNSWGRDRFWHPVRGTMDRLVRRDPSLPLLDAQKTTVIRHNRFQTAHGWDIDLDDGSSNYHIYNNLCLEGGLKLREGFARRVENNILVNNGFHPHVWFVDSGDIFRHNLVMRPHPDIRLQGWGREVDRNIFVSEEDLSRARSRGVEAHGRFATVTFMDPAVGDFTVLGDDAVFEAGFRNFPMDNFGVQVQHLKAIAQQPVFPGLQ